MKDRAAGEKAAIKRIAGGDGALVNPVRADSGADPRLALLGSLGNRETVLLFAVDMIRPSR